LTHGSIEPRAGNVRVIRESVGTEEFARVGVRGVRGARGQSAERICVWWWCGTLARGSIEPHAENVQLF
jgi:hypothetical protein